MEHCDFCGKDFEGTGRKRKAQYCSSACATALWRQRNADKLKEQREARIPKKRGRKMHPRKACEVCGKPIRLEAKHYCSQECAIIAWRVPDPLPRACAACGREFTPNRNNRHKATCSKCAWDIWKKTNPSSASKTRDKARAVRRTNGQQVDRIDRQEVFGRDGWVCGICGKKVNRRLKHPNPMSVSLDHIIPLAKGGTHTLSNVQCSHLICNNRKSAGGIGQLRLGLDTTHQGL